MCGDVHATSDMEIIEVCNRELLICKKCEDVCERQAALETICECYEQDLERCCGDFDGDI